MSASLNPVPSVSRVNRPLNASFPVSLLCPLCCQTQMRGNEERFIFILVPSFREFNGWSLGPHSRTEHHGEKNLGQKSLFTS